VTSARKARRRKPTRDERSRTPRETTTAVAPTPSLWTRPLIAIVVIGALLRGYYLTQPMRYDESVTYLYFASQSWTTVVSSYTYPNNHVFHSLLVKAFATILGDDPWVLRSLPASRGFQPPTCADLARIGPCRSANGGSDRVALFADRREQRPGCAHREFVRSTE
jgi:hypothetical protein